MDDLAIARALHVFGVVLWIGGVAFVTTTLLPAVRRFEDAEDQVAFFEKVEHRFARQARWTTLLVGLSGFYLGFAMDLWDRFSQASYWWMHAMVFVWAVFTVMLFIAEPLFVHRWFRERAARDPVRTVAFVQRMHWVLLSLSLVTVVGAVLGSHGS